MAWTAEDDVQVEKLRQLSITMRESEQSIRDILRDLVSRHGCDLSAPAFQFERQTEEDLDHIERDLDDADRHRDGFVGLLKDAAEKIKDKLGRAA